jgi:hypothetical protein
LRGGWPRRPGPGWTRSTAGNARWPAGTRRAILLDRAPADIIGGNRARLADGDQMMHLRDVWRGHFAEPRLDELVTGLGDGAGEASGYDAEDHKRLALTSAAKGLPGAELDSGQRDLLRALLATYLGRVPEACRLGRSTPTTPRSTPSTSRGPGPRAPASRITTACRGRGC